MHVPGSAIWRATFHQMELALANLQIYFAKANIKRTSVIFSLSMGNLLQLLRENLKLGTERPLFLAK
jgi:hypothetical protein